MMAGAAHRQWERGLPDLPQSLLTIREVAEGAVKEMRGLLHELLPPGLEDGLAPALAKLVSVLQLRSEAPIVLDGETQVRFAGSTETAVYRIVQEALGNAIKHAQATELRVCLVEHPEHLEVSVSDDGVGFDPRVAAQGGDGAKSGGIGMHSMRERAAAAGLRLWVTSVPGEGTRVAMEAPL
jgi:signal transduction histidine kinase